MSDYLLTNVSVAFVYKDATFKSETISQTCLGETLEILQKQGDWFRVRQEDEYEGWVADFFVVEKPADWDKGIFFNSSELVTFVRENASQDAPALRDMTIVSQLPVLTHKDGWVKLRLPDGLEGWVEDRPLSKINVPEPETLVQTAFRFLGIQYFWGGKTPKGFDCSGFTQTIYKLNGYQLPRDAYMQADIGQVQSDDFRDWQAGDLLFFSERDDRITHVTLALNEGDFIHASGRVRVNSLNPGHEDLYSEKLNRQYVRTMRIIDTV